MYFDYIAPCLHIGEPIYHITERLRQLACLINSSFTQTRQLKCPVRETEFKYIMYVKKKK